MHMGVYCVCMCVRTKGMVSVYTERGVPEVAVSLDTGGM